MRPMRAFRTTCAVLIVVRSAMTARTVVAQTTSESAAQAEALFREGRVLIKAGQTSDACAKFAESQRLDPQTGTLLNLALCHEDEGKTASAWAEFNEVSERSGATSERVEFAQRHARQLEGKLSNLKLRLDPAVSNFSLTLDGRPLRSASLGSTIPLDPGEHAVAATAPGKTPWVARVKIAPGPATQEVTIHLADAPHAAAEIATAPSAAPSANDGPAPVTRPAAAEPGSKSTGRRDVGLAIGAVGVVGIGVGTIYGLLAFAKKQEIENKCPPSQGCPSQQEYNDALDAKAQRDAASTVATVAFAVGGIGVATGLYLVLTAPSSKDATAHNVRVSPMPVNAGFGAMVGGNL
jgi:hypothetical protein